MTELCEQSFLAALAAQYGLNDPKCVAQIAQGFLSRNYVIRAEDERYFLKQYRFTGSNGDLQAKTDVVHRAKFHFYQAGIPVVLPLPDKADRTFFIRNGRSFALFPFIDEAKPTRGRLSPTTLDSAGSTLARIHRAGCRVYDIAPKMREKAFDASSFWNNSEGILNLIEKKRQPSRFDQLARESLLLKRRLASQHSPSFNELALQDDHLIHGDYHNGNFFVDAAGKVCFVFDWEMTKVTAREVELLRSLLFMCLQTSETFEPLLTEDAWRRAATYLKSYCREYPVHPEKMAAAVQNRFLGTIYSIWIEEAHYLDDNNRVDLFLSGSVQLLKYLSEKRDVFTSWLIGRL